MSESTSGTDEPGGELRTLEEKLKRLEVILSQLEADEVDLERALALFEEGVQLVRRAERTLAETTLRVDELLAGGASVPLEEDDAR